MKTAMLKKIACFALAVVMALGTAVTVFAWGDTYKLPKADESAHVPFSMKNMFPGDSETKDYKIKVDHAAPVTLHFHADVTGETGELSKALEIKVEVLELGTTIYNGPIGEMPASVDIELGYGDTRKPTYRITVTLPTSAGNEYQNKNLTADFRWWYLEEEGDPVIVGGSEEVKITAEKYVNGGKIEGKEFEFVLKDADGKVVAKANNDGSNIEFPAVSLKTGTHKFYITETKGNNSNINYDTVKYEVVVEVVRTEKGANAYLTYYKGGEEYESLPRFNNSTKDGSDYNPDTGFDPTIAIGAAAVLGLGFMAFVIIKRRKKGGEANG